MPDNNRKPKNIVEAAKRLVNEREQNPAESARKLSVLSAGIAFIAALMVIAFTAVFAKISFDEFFADDYIVEHVTDRIVAKLPKAEGYSTLEDTGHRVRNRSLVVDASKVGEYETIEDVYSGSDEDKISKFLYQSESLSTVYDYGDSDYYVAYLDVSGDNGTTEHPQDAVFARDNVDGEVIGCVNYDAENGLAYIPKSFFESEAVEGLEENQVELLSQTLVRYDYDKVSDAYAEDASADVVGNEPSLGQTSKENVIPVEITTLSGRASKMAQVPLTGTQFSIKVAEGEDSEALSTSNIKVSVNDGALELNGRDNAYEAGSVEPGITYDSNTGSLNVYNVSPISTMNLEISVPEYVKPSMAVRGDISYAGEILNPTDLAYSIGAFGQANCSGRVSSGGAYTKTIAGHAPTGGNWLFSYITKSDISNSHSAYVISIGNCPTALGSDWSANKWQLWAANCVHAIYPTGSNPPRGGYWKILDADWNAQMVIIAFFVTCDQDSQQEGAMVLNFYAPRNGQFDIYKKSNANPSLGSAIQSNVAGAKFGVYATQEAAKNQDSSKLVKTMTTDGEGHSSANFDDGTYWVREISAPWPYLVSDQIVSFTSRPKSKDKSVFYDDSVPPVQIIKKIIPSANSYVEADVVSGGKVQLHVKSSVSADGKSVVTTLEAKQDVSNVSIRNSNTVVMTEPSSIDSRYNTTSKLLSSMHAGEKVTFTQSFKNGQGWSNENKLATTCSISVGTGRADMSLKLNSTSLEGTKYGFYTDEACTNRIGEATLGANGVGYFGKTYGQWLEPNTKYWIRETASVNGYSVSPSKYSVTTGRNSQVSVCVADSFTTIILEKLSGAGSELTNKLAQFSLKGAKYGVYATKQDALTHDASKVMKTKDGRDAILTTDSFGKGVETALGEGTYYIAELPSSITRPWKDDNGYRDFRPTFDIEASVKNHDYSSKSNGQFLIDEQIYEVKMNPGSTTFQSSEENIPIKIQLSKQSTRSDLAQLPQFSLEGTAFGVYKSEADARADKVGNYGQNNFFIPESSEETKAVAILYGNKEGKTTVSEELPLGDYYIKELRAPRNYKFEATSKWIVDGKERSAVNGILHLTPSDFMSSSKFIDGVLTNVSVARANEPADVTVQVQKDSSEVPNGMKNSSNAMSLAGAKFAIYKTYDDAATDKNRLSFNTDDNPNGPKTEYLVSRADGWTNKAIALPAESCYWVREIEPPHTGNDISKSMYVLDSQSVKATFTSDTSVDMTAYKDDKVKPVSITIGKYPVSMDSQGRNLHIDYNSAYTGSALEGAIFALFNTQADAEKVAATTNLNDVSVIDKAKAAGAIAVMTSDSTGVCGTVDNLPWKADGYYVKELKAPTSGCYQLNKGIKQVLCDANQQTNAHIILNIKSDVINKRFDVEEYPDYYYVKIEKVSSDPSVLSDTANYSLEGIHFGIYATYDEANKATEANPGKPLYNLYTKKVTYANKSVHYEAITGVTGPGTFWAKELYAENDYPRGFQVLTQPVRVEAKKGTIPTYDSTPIVPENGKAKVNPTTGKLSYKTARDIDASLGTLRSAGTMILSADEVNNLLEPVENESIPSVANKSANAVLGTLNPPVAAISDAQYDVIRTPRPTASAIKADISDIVEQSSTPNMKNQNVQLAPEIVGSFITHKGIGPTRADVYNRYWTNGVWHNADFTDYYEYSYDLPAGATETWAFHGFDFHGSNIRIYYNLTEKHEKWVTYGPKVRTGYTWDDWWIDNIRVYPGDTWDFWKSVNVYAWAKPNNYTVTFNAGVDSGASNMPSSKSIPYETTPTNLSSIPKRVGYTFTGFYDAKSGGTKYFDKNGKAVREWDKASNGVLYAQWTENSYKIKYSVPDPNTSLAKITDAPASPITVKYTQSVTLPNVHKFGYKLKGWKYTDSTGQSRLAAAGSQVSRLRTGESGSTEITLTADWGDKPNEYRVKFNNGLSTSEWKISPSIVKGNNPDNDNKPWSDGYEQLLYYDDYAADGISSDTLVANKYYHSNFTFKYWTDGTNKYADKQAVKNLTTPGNTKVLTGVWFPSISYGAECEANVIANQPLGGVTIQKVVTGTASSLSDLSGIVFDLFSDSNCTKKVKSATTNVTGIATFSGLTANTTYYAKEVSIPAKLTEFMEKSSAKLTVSTNSKTAYKFENSSKLLSLKLMKKPSKNVISNVPANLLADLAPSGAKFALYASAADAASDSNRITFIDENGHKATIATVSNIVSVNGIFCATTTISGLPNKNLYLKELSAPDHGKQEYKLSSSPVLIEASKANNGVVSIDFENDMDLSTNLEITKAISSSSLDSIPEAQKTKAQSLTDGIQYAIYNDRASAAKRDDSYAKLLTMTYDSKTNVSSASTDKLPFGTYYMIEYSITDEARKAGIVLSDEIMTVSFDSKTKKVSLAMTDELAPETPEFIKLDGDDSSPIEGVIFDIYDDDPKANSNAVLLTTTTPTDSIGKASTIKPLLTNISYYAVERYDSLPAEYSGNGVGSDNTWSGWIELSDDGRSFETMTIENYKNDETGSIEVYKASNTHADTSGAIFSVYDETGALFGTMETVMNEDGLGYAKLDEIPLGTYLVRETTALPMHSLTDGTAGANAFETSVTLTASAKDQSVSTLSDPVMNYQGYVKVHKTMDSSQVENESLRDLYSLEGAVYSLYPFVDDEPSATPLTETLITDVNGDTQTLAVPLGKYKIVETTEPINFSTPAEMKEFIVEVTLKDNANADTPLVVESEDYPMSEPMADFLVEKRSSETFDLSDGSPQGVTTLGGTKFMVEYSPKIAKSYDEARSIDKSHHWVVATDDSGRTYFNEESILKDESDEVFRDTTGTATLPVGTITVKEIAPPIGYTNDVDYVMAYAFNGENGKFEELLPDEDIRELDGVPTFAAKNDIHRADVSFHKVDAYDSNKIMSGVPFLLTLLDENGEALERHLIATDANGHFDSRTGASVLGEVNANDKWIPGDVVNGCVDAAFESEHHDSRPWFTGSHVEVDPDASKGALIYGDYELREFYREDTLNYQSLEPIRFSVRGDDTGSWIECNGVIVRDGDLNKAIGNVENHAIRITSTEFLDSVTKTHLMSRDSLIATETIRYADATPGEEYYFEIVAYDAETKMPITKPVKEVTGEINDLQAGASYVLTSSGTSGDVTVDVSFEGYDVTGKTIALVTKVYHGVYLSDKHNENLDDAAESVQFATVGTQARDKDTEQKIGISDGKIDIIDKVTYHNLVVGFDYEISGILMNKETNTPLLDINGNTITAHDTFTAQQSDGERELLFSLESAINSAFNAVAFETLSMESNIIASHEEIDDVEQTTVYPSVVTTARDGATNDFTGNASGEQVSIIDKIVYKNLIPGIEYEARGVLYIMNDDGTRTKLEDSDVSTVFIADAEDDFVEMTFIVNSNDVRGNRVSVGEEIYCNDKIIARHDDVSFDDQIVAYPSVGTTATDITTNLHVGCGEDDTVLVDVVELHGLKPNTAYTISGRIMGRNTDGAVFTTAITATETFIASDSSENHLLKFLIPSNFEYDTAVAYEQLRSEHDVLLSSHEDPFDEGQSVHYPNIGTVALHPATETHVGSNVDNVIVDTVEYHNLVPGYEYELSGLLVDKESGEFVSNANNTAPIAGSATFVPTDANGFVDVTFELGDVDVAGKTLVVFEQMHVINSVSDDENADDKIDGMNKSLVATHCDIESESQSMFYPALATSAVDYASSSHVGSSLSGGDIVDTVTYTNLVVGYEYEVIGTLMDKATANVITQDGLPVVASTKFVATQADGEVTVTFEGLNADTVSNKTIVAFEKLMLVGCEMANHDDINDREQSVCYPSIKTTATDLNTGLHEGVATEAEAEDGFVRVIDEVRYENVAAGEEYNVEGQLIDKETGNSVATSNASFVATAIDEYTAQTSGVVKLEFKVPIDEAYGKTFVAFEKLYSLTNTEIANHEDINDEDQTVSYPKIGTVALDGKTRTHAGSFNGISIVDSISYEGLLQGHSYVAYGTLMDKDTGEIVVDADGNEVISSSEFIADEGGKGNAEVTFAASVADENVLPGKTFVAFERIEEKDDAQHRAIAMHEDIDDEDQSVHYPSVRTIARAEDGTNEFSYLSDARITDTILYENIVPGVEYRIDGELMNKWTESALLVDGNAVTSSATFVPSTSSGSVEVVFEFDGTTTEQCVTVAFERVSVEGELVAQHTDFDDITQTMNAFLVADELIDVGEDELPLTTIVQEYLISQTGDEGWRYVVVATCMILSAGTIVLMRRRLLR